MEDIPDTYYVDVAVGNNHAEILTTPIRKVFEGKGTITNFPSYIKKRNNKIWIKPPPVDSCCECGGRHISGWILINLENLDNYVIRTSSFGYVYISEIMGSHYTWGG
jgi:hypothetical protein